MAILIWRNSNTNFEHQSVSLDRKGISTHSKALSILIKLVNPVLWSGTGHKGILTSRICCKHLLQLHRIEMQPRFILFLPQFPVYKQCSLSITCILNNYVLSYKRQMRRRRNLKTPSSLELKQY